jgi:AraC family transcriptional regulator
MICLTTGKFFGDTVSTGRFGPFAITTSSYGAGNRLPRHYHSQAYLFVVLSGGIREETLRRATDCTRGWLVCNMAAEAHQDEILDRGALGLNVEISTQWLARFREAYRLREPVFYQHAGPAVAAVGALDLALCTRDSLQRLGVEEAVVRLLESVCGSAAGIRRRPRWLGKAEELIRRQPSFDLTLTEIAEAAGVHPAHACREFRHALGCTMTQYAARLRADKALVDVLRSDAPLAAIAAGNGFSDQAHLTRAIRNHFGTTPGKIRRERA